MNMGRLIAVVGPSGVGKDSVMAGIMAQKPDLRRVCRVITRNPDLGGEDYQAVTPKIFAQMAQDGAFCIHWQAHGLQYGIPSDVQSDLAKGIECLANFSRAALPRATALFPTLTVLHITAAPDVLAQRLAARGRESQADIARRLHQSHAPLPDGLTLHTIRNDGALQDAVAQAMAALYPVRA